jgi:hypothetical protein
VWLVGVAYSPTGPEGGRQVSDGDSSSTVSGQPDYRDNMAGGHVGDGKNTYRWERAICASSQDWAGPLLSG